MASNPRKISAVDCNCAGAANKPELSATYVCGDVRLGPIKLPTGLPNLYFKGYDRFAGLQPKAFLDEYWDPTPITHSPTGQWKYPPENGFLLDLDKKPIKGYVKLLKGTRVDRFGFENGMSEAKPVTVAGITQDSIQRFMSSRLP